MSKMTWGGCGVCIVIGFLVGLLADGKFFSGSSQRSVSVTLPGGVGLDLQATQDGILLDSLYSRLYADRSFRDGLIARLAEDHIYQLTDPRLADALHDHLCSPIPDQPLTERTNAARACADLPVARRLRELAEMRNVPFHYVGRELNIGVPSHEDQPMPGMAHTCKNSEFGDHTVELSNPRSDATITVRATGSYVCTGFTQYPDIQLSYSDAKELFGRPTNKYESAIAVVLD